VQAAPLTSKVDRLHPSEAYVTLKGKQSKAMADQLTTVSKSRLSKADIQEVEQIIKVQLGLTS
jgi:mRNA interferase MazF